VVVLILIAYGVVAGITAYGLRGYVREDAMDWMGLLTNHQVNTTQAASSIFGNTGAMMEEYGRVFKHAKTVSETEAELLATIKELKITYENLIASQENSGRTNVRQAMTDKSPTVTTSVPIVKFDSDELEP
jgi:hypothetical protein